MTVKYQIADVKATISNRFSCLADIVHSIPERASVLDVGCSSGYLSSFLQSELGCSVDGVEISPEAASEAAAFQVQTFIGDLNDADFVESVNRSGGYDRIVFSNVLEHLVDPGFVLSSFRGKLSKNGLAIVTLPNIAHFGVRKSLFFGNFDYADYGILDRTHLRFFTKSTARSMIASSGFEVLETKGSFYFPGYKLVNSLPLVAKALKWLVNGPLSGILSVEITYLCRPV